MLTVLLLACSNQTPVSDGLQPTQPEAAQHEAAQPEAAQPEPTRPHAIEASNDDQDPLPDVSINLPHGLCNNGPGGSGADSYFVGSFHRAPTGITGTETWYLHANTTWIAAGGSDCRIVWVVTGEVRSPTRCTSCEFGVSATAILDTDRTTCPEGLYKDEETQQLEYDILNKQDSSSEIRFSQSGNLLGEGYHSPHAFNYVSAHSCKWF